MRHIVLLGFFIILVTIEAQEQESRDKKGDDPSHWGVGGRRKRDAVHHIVKRKYREMLKNWIFGGGGSKGNNNNNNGGMNGGGGGMNNNGGGFGPAPQPGSSGSSTMQKGLMAMLGQQAIRIICDRFFRGSGQGQAGNVRPGSQWGNQGGGGGAGSQWGNKNNGGGGSQWGGGGGGGGGAKNGGNNAGGNKAPGGSQWGGSSGNNGGNGGWGLQNGGDGGGSSKTVTNPESNGATGGSGGGALQRSNSWGGSSKHHPKKQSSNRGWVKRSKDSDTHRIQKRFGLSDLMSRFTGEGFSKRKMLEELARVYICPYLG